jgi:hypothetical protein
VELIPGPDINHSYSKRGFVYRTMKVVEIEFDKRAKRAIGRLIIQAGRKERISNIDAEF